MRKDGYSNDGNLRLDEVLADYLQRIDRGESVSEEAFVQANPEFSDQLRSYFNNEKVFAHPPVAETRDFHNQPTPPNALRIRCPHCHSVVDHAVDAEFVDLTCDTCGSHFSLVDNASATRTAETLRKIGRFELIERLGVGGFGTVWKARDTELDRTVAVKVPRQGEMTSSEVEKFLREARAAAQLRHSNIVSVHEVGRDGDSVYIVSDLIRGVDLSDWLTGQQLTSREAAELIAKVCDALHHAHEQGVIHRDLKPANIMMDAEGEPHLMDFGLARREVGEVTMTIDGQVLGTPAYMSPEQAQGESHTADRRSDVYSAGAILFELLTGERPFRGNARMLLHQVIHEQAPSPRKLNANIAKDLETITLKCLEKVPDGRYESAKELSEELKRFLCGESIHARPISRIESVLRWTYRNKAVSLVSAVALLSLVGGTFVSLMFAFESRRFASDALIAKDVAEAKEAETAVILDFVEDKVIAAARPQGQEGGLGRDVTLLHSIKNALPYVESSFAHQPVVEGRLRNTLGVSFLHLGETELAAQQFAKAIELFSKHLGSSDPNTLSSMSGLAKSYCGQGRYDEATVLHEKELTLRKEHLGPNEPDTLENMNSLANCYFFLGRYTQALQLHEEALTLRQEHLGPHDPDTLNSMNNVANCYYALGRHPESLELHEEALALTKSTLGPNHPQTIRNINDLALSCAALGRHVEALQLHEEALALLTSSLGPEHYLTLRGTDNLARILATSHNAEVLDCERAVELAAHACEMSAYANPDYLSTLATAYAGLQDFDSAVEWSERAIELMPDADEGRQRRAIQALRDYKSKQRLKAAQQ